MIDETGAIFSAKEHATVESRVSMYFLEVARERSNVRLFTSVATSDSQLIRRFLGLVFMFRSVSYLSLKGAPANQGAGIRRCTTTREPGRVETPSVQFCTIPVMNTFPEASVAKAYGRAQVLVSKN